MARPIECFCAACAKPFLRLRHRGSMTECTPCQNNRRVREWKAANPERAKAINTQPTAEQKRRYAQTPRGMEVNRQKSLRHYHKDVERSRERNRELYAAKLDRPVHVPMTPEAVREASCAKARRYYHKDAEASRARSRARYAADRDACIQKVVDRSSRVRTAMPPWADRAAIAALYAQARRLTRETGLLHHVDHDIPLRGATVHGLHVETNLRVLPAAVNQSKSNRYEGNA